MTEDTDRCLSPSFTALMSRVLDTPLPSISDFAPLINALKSNDQRLKAIIASNEQTKQRFLNLGKEIKDLQSLLANRGISCLASEADLGLMMTSHLPRTLAKGKRLIVSCRLINKQGQPMTLYHLIDCYLNIQNVTEDSADTSSHYRQNSEVRTWHSTLNLNGEVTFYHVRIPNIVPNTQHNKLTLTISCPNEGRIQALVLEGLPIKINLPKSRRGKKNGV